MTKSEKKKFKARRARIVALREKKWEFKRIAKKYSISIQRAHQLYHLGKKEQR